MDYAEYDRQYRDFVLRGIDPEEAEVMAYEMVLEED